MKHITFKIPATLLLFLLILGACASEECRFYEKTKRESSPVTDSTDNLNIKNLQKEIRACGAGQNLTALIIPGSPAVGNIAACVKNHLNNFARKHDCD